MRNDNLIELYEGDDVTILIDCDENKGRLAIHTWYGSNEIEISKELYYLMKKELHGKL